MVSVYLFVLSAGMMLIIPGEVRRRRIRLRIASFYARRVCKTLKLNVERAPSVHEKVDGLLVSNHLSFFDILVHASQHPSVFVTSCEMEETPFVGGFVKLAGGMFVERRHRRHLERDILRMETLLRSGFSVTLFPEGTTGDGSRVLPFKAGLFSSAVKSGISLIPTTLNYQKWNGLPVSSENREGLFYIGDQTLFQHLWRIFTVTSVHVHYKVHEPLIFPVATDPRRAADELRAIVAGSFLPCA